MTDFATKHYIVIGDIGGTNCRLELLPVEHGAYGRSKEAPLCGGTTTNCLPPALCHARYRTTSAPSVLHLLERFSEEPCYQTALQDGKIVLYSLSVCGPVSDGVAILTSQAFGEDGWRVDSHELSTAFGCKVSLLNDFHAVGLSLPEVPQGDVHVLYDAKGRIPDKYDITAWLGPGTGLGQGFALWAPDCKQVSENQGDWIICGSEGGMSDFIVKTDDDWELKKFIASQGDLHDPYAFVDVEHVVSGTGIGNIYKWLRYSRPHLISDAELDQTIMESDQPAKLICEALANELCQKTVDIFLAALGSEAANLALRYQAKGGVYIAGGITSKIMDFIKDGRVARSYVDKGHSLLAYENCPLYAVSKPGDDLGLTGAYLNAIKHYDAMTDLH